MSSCRELPEGWVHLRFPEPAPLLMNGNGAVIYDGPFTRFFLSLRGTRCYFTFFTF